MLADASSLITSLTNFGGLGIVIAFLIWKDIRADRIRERMEEAHRAQILVMEEKRLAYDKDRLDADKQQSAVLAALNASIQSIGRK